MNTRFRRLVAGAVAAVGLVSVLPLVGSTVTAAPGDLPAGPININPPSGNSQTDFTLAFPTSQTCPGKGSDGYRWHTFITPITADVGAFTWSNQGAPIGGPGFTRNLSTSSGSAVRGQSPDNVDGGIANIPVNMELAGGGVYGPAPAIPIPEGEYKVGIACSFPGPTTIDTVKFWSVPVTITADAVNGGSAQVVYARGVRPSAPVLATAVGGDGQLSGTFTHAASDPATTGYTAAATPQGGGAATTVSLPSGATSFTITGLTNGTTYDVTVTATNSIGTSSPSNTLSATPALNAQPAGVFTATPAAEACTVAFSPAGGAFGTLDQVVFSGTGPTTITSVTDTAGPFTATFTGLQANGAYTFTATPTYSAPNPSNPQTVTCVPLSGAAVIQEISVTRPPGALVLTQRCGVQGPIDAWPSVNAFPGYPLPLSADPLGNGATFAGTPPFLGPNGTGGTDPSFVEYPTPSPYLSPTYCGLPLGTAELIGQGDLAGYYVASGRLNQVTVFDTRDGDLGWTARGEMSSFVSTTGPASFRGSFLGWDPQVNDTTVTAGYTQVVTDGPLVQPGTGITLAGGDTGLGNGEVLATAAAGSGLGGAIIDARVTLLIPPSVPAGTYEGDLTLSAF